MKNNKRNIMDNTQLTNDNSQFSTVNSQLKKGAALSLPKGYKNTEIGVIPVEWKVVKIENIMKPKGIVRGPFGGALKKEYFKKEGYKVYEQRNAIYQNITQGNYYIDKIKFNELKRFSVNEGDFIVSCSGTIGKIYKIPRKFKQGIINQALLKLTVDEEKIKPQYFYYQFIDENFQNRVVEDQGGAMKNLVGMPQFKSSLLILPPLHEQTAIATVLSDTDALIQALEKKIAKKQLIKKGAMQTLLSPKKGWVVKTLGEVAEIKTGTKNNQDKIKDGKYPFFVRSQTVERLNTYSYDCEAILIPGEGGIGSIYHYINGKFEVHQRVYKISNFKNTVSGKFIYLYVKMNFYKHAMKNSVKATVDSLRLPTFLEFELNLPSIQEQTRIAQILSDMDTEIEALEKKLAKYKQIKQGLMQVLLTGKIRLV